MQTDRLSIVSGKGGVGKSMTAAGLALAEAAAGRRTLLAEMNGQHRLARLFGVPEEGSTLREVSDNLWLVDVNPADSIREYILMTLRFETLYRALFENRVMGSLLRLMPALGQLTMLGKLWFHAGEKRPEGPRFQSMVIDAPATGHMRAMAEAPRKVAASVPPGPMRETADRLDRWLTDSVRTRLFTVALAEPMPIQETRELIEMAETLGVPLGPIVVNQKVAPLSQGARDALVSGLLPATLTKCLQARDREAQKAEEAAQTLPQLASPPVFLPYVALSPNQSESDLARAHSVILGPALRASFERTP